ncbi:MAG: hypothetical protein K0R84_1024 [Clostridia bacterium]|nr:hypothetical protein [Clostridia bacterium]
MKKAIAVILILALVFSFSACTNTNQTPEPTTPVPTPSNTGAETPAPGTTTPATNWRDGTFEGKGDKWEYGDEDAVVVISGGKISNITLRRYTTEGQEVNYEEWTGAEVEGQKRPNLKQFREDLAQAIIEKQSTTVDDIAGATVSSKNWKLAVERALEQAEVK